MVSANRRGDRRAFLQNGTLVMAATTLRSRMLTAEDSTELLRVGLVTDLHHADKPAAGSRYYRETLPKLREAARQFAAEKPSFLVELGDLIDAADTVETELSYLSTINDAFSGICPDRHYVLGNHCVDMLKKEEFLGGVGQKAAYYSFDHGGIHFVVLDACFRSDGEPYGRKNSQWTDANIPPTEIDWLVADLKANTKPVIVFAHQRLDEAGNHAVKNNAQVRGLLENAGNVLAVFQGHSHKNDLQDIRGIHYCTLVAMVEGSGAENNAYTLLSIQSDFSLRVRGFRKQRNYQWAGV